MNFKKLVSVIGISALSVSMFAGAAVAQEVDDDQMKTSVNITCPTPMTVSIGGNGAFAPITDSINQRDTSTGKGDIEVEVDMGCYWGEWSVDAQTTNFSAGGGKRFSASHFSLVDPTVETYAADPLDGPFDILKPTANPAYFYGASDSDTILETSENWILWWQLPDTPAPFVTTASYTGVLSDLPFLLSGEYEATLTVVLSAD